MVGNNNAEFELISLAPGMEGHALQLVVRLRAVRGNECHIE